jgi:hypothetical protein
MISTRWTRRLAPLALALIVGLSPAPARAQEPPPEGTTGESSGRPFDGYFLMGILAFAALFVVGKSARR